MRTDASLLVDMLENAKVALGYCAGVSWEAFQTNNLIQDAVIRRVSIVGEAARLVSDPARNELPQLPWGRIVGMRHLLIHEYGGVNLRAVWTVVQDHLSILISSIDQYLQSKGIQKDQP